MTVRAWFTISALAVLALFVAALFRLFGPVGAPQIIARADSVRLEGRLESACWPRRGGQSECETPTPEPARDVAIPGRGTFRFFVGFPSDPDDGSITIKEGKRTILNVHDWKRSLAYQLEAGNYTLRVEARYPHDAFLAYSFPFKVTRAGS